MAPNVQLTKEGELNKDLKRYRRLIGKLNYIIVSSPNIAYSVSVVNQILCYLKGTHEHGICIRIWTYQNYILFKLRLSKI